MASESNKGLLSLNIKGKSALYVSYMPFIKNGGVFIPSKKSSDYNLGDDIFVLLTIDDSKEKIPIAGKISSLLNMKNLKKFKKRLDPRLYNGAIFIGLDSPVVKSHGGTDYIGFSNSLTFVIKL